mmetsp:Transcript_6877/g.9514  ORF Transcript_6877/g.9514 Transcript_6877/m.9514 type:complete len:370 (-) Transcript_6877:135-1244(-)
MQEQTLEDIREGTLALQLLQTGALGRVAQPKLCKNQSSDEEQSSSREKNSNEFEGRDNIQRTKRRISSHQGTQITYISMVSEAIRALGGQATCPQIASYMEKHFSSLLANRKVKQWRNSVSGCLSTYCIRHGRDAQGRVVWKLNEENDPQPTRKPSPAHKQEKLDSSSHDEEEFDDEEEEPEEEEYLQSEEDEDFVNSRPRKLKRSRSDAPSTPEKKPTQPQSPKTANNTQPRSVSETTQQQENFALLHQKLENVISTEPLKKRLKGSASGSESPQSPQSPQSPISPLSPSPRSPPSPTFQAHQTSPSKTLDEKSFQDFLVNKLQAMQDQIGKMTDEIALLRSEVQTLKKAKTSSTVPSGMIPISTILS